MALVTAATNPYITEAFISRFLTMENYAQSLPYINAIFGDAIVIWRAWVIWGRSWRVAIGPILLLLGTLAVILAQIVLGNRLGYLQAAESLLSSKTLLRLNVASYALTLATNAVATAMIAYRAWLHHRSSSTVRIRIGRDRALAVLLLLVESGAIYCTLWIADIVLWTLPASTVGGSFDFLVPLLPQLMTMYPTVIVVLCAVERSYTDNVMLDKHSGILPTAYRTPDHPGSHIHQPSSATTVAFATSQNGHLSRMASSTSPVSSMLDVNNVDPEKTLPPLPHTMSEEDTRPASLLASASSSPYSAA
ncbi:hypothetical protein FA95DRAFT_1600788 [Auriscalpium vulgare]|uniref:Uncharacterized protein n=1 Tax=Auriscalpium vulgare TaxID=40419 RepID=A0ACB8SBS5_9AGAM|nr:hypothetical protein FA95DRAFT_1600788 [Auriscalpium vulgare]